MTKTKLKEWTIRICELTNQPEGEWYIDKWVEYLQVRHSLTRSGWWNEWIIHCLMNCRRTSNSIESFRSQFPSNGISKGNFHLFEIEHLIGTTLIWVITTKLKIFRQKHENFHDFFLKRIRRFGDRVIVILSNTNVTLECQMWYQNDLNRKCSESLSSDWHSSTIRQIYSV